MSGPECPKCKAKPLALYGDGTAICRSCGWDSRDEKSVKWVELEVKS